MQLRPFTLLLAVILLPLGPARLGAQDVTVGEPQWFSPDAAPEILPQSKSKLRPEYPDDLRKLTEIGYVAISRHVDAAGKGISLGAIGTHPLFQRAVEGAFQGWNMAPAQHGGQPVAARIWVPVIFNPKSAPAKGGEAAPRLLAVTPVVTKEKIDVAPGQPPLVRMKLSLDATGAITAAEPEGPVKPAVLAAIRAALPAWKFAPARTGGQPVPAEIVVPVVCQRPMSTDAARQTPPKAIKQVAPEFPVALRASGLRGEVTLDFEIDTDGSVKNPVVATSSNPGFNEAAVEALLQWKFQPAQRDGKPVKTKLRVPIIFNPSPLRSGREAYAVEGPADQNKLPENLRYDTAAKIRGAIVPVYPYALRRDGVRGSAKAVMAIDPRGRVFGVKVHTADKPELGLALTAALEGFSFDPALRDGKPVEHIVTFEQRFDERTLPDESGVDLLALEKKHPEKIVGAGALDTPLKPLSRRAPIPPTAWPAGVEKGEAMIEVLIDRTGHVRLPRIVSASADCFGYAAVQAVAAWQFEPPLVAGKPVVVRARVPFAFTFKTAKPAVAPEGK